MHRGEDTDETDLAGMLQAEHWSLHRQKLTQQPAAPKPRSRIR